MGRKSETFLLAGVLCILMVSRAFGLDTVGGGADEGISRFANWLVDELSGPIGLILAVVGAAGAWFESKFGSPKEVIWATVLITSLPFLLAMLLKVLYNVG